MDFSLVAGSRGASLVAVHGFLTVVASLLAEHRIEGTWALVVVVPPLQNIGSIVVAKGYTGLVALQHVGSSQIRN